MEITRSEYNFFDDLANYLIMIVTISLTAEVYIAGKADKYKTNDSISLDGKQVGKRLSFYPSSLLEELYKLKWPDTFRFVEETKDDIPPDAILKLGPLEKPMQTIEKSMFINYFERNRRHIESKYGLDTNKWPDDWNFARVVRNAYIHDGSINFRNQNANPVNWLNLNYSPKDNGRQVQYNDLWPGDTIYLMIEMESHL